MTNELDTSFKFRLPAMLLKEFSAACEENDQTAAQVLRAAIRDYVRTNSRAQRELLPTVKGKLK